MVNWIKWMRKLGSHSQLMRIMFIMLSFSIVSFEIVFFEIDVCEQWIDNIDFKLIAFLEMTFLYHDQLWIDWHFFSTDSLILVSNITFFFIDSIRQSTTCRIMTEQFLLTLSLSLSLSIQLFDLRNNRFIKVNHILFAFWVHWNCCT